MSFQDSILHYQQLADHSLKQGNFVSYINNIQQVYELKREGLGPMNLEVIQLHDALITQMNHYGIVALQKQDMEQSLTLLKKAEEVSATDRQKVSTFNNLACFYRRIGKLRTALTYLQQALQLELTLPSSPTLSDTYLNMCAVLSQLNKHEDALQHIYLSIIMLQHEILMKTLNNTPNDIKNNGLSSKSTTIERDSRADSQSQDSSRLSLYFKPSSLQERVAVLVVAYHNLGVEMEHLKKSLEAKKIYQSALGLAEQNLNKNHQMTAILRQLNKDQKENVQNTEKCLLPGLQSTKPKFSIPRTTLSVMNSTRRNPKGLKLFAPVMQLQNPLNEPIKSASIISQGSPVRFSPLTYAPKTITLKSMSVNSPLEMQQQQSLGRRSMHESFTLG